MIPDHFYTTSTNERDNAIAFFNYISEGAACHVFGFEAPGSVQLIRLVNINTGDHFYTTSKDEADNAVNLYAYISEGPARYVFESPVPDSTELYRLFNQVNGDHFYTTSQIESEAAVATSGYQLEGTACFVFSAAVTGTIPLFRLLNVEDANAVNVVKAPWAVLLCKCANDESEPPNAMGVLPFKTVCEKFFTKRNATFNAVQFFFDMSHGKIDLSDSKVLGWYTIDVNKLDDNGKIDKEQFEVVDLARKAAEDDGFSLDDFAGVVLIMNIATGWAQGAYRWMAADWRRVDGRNFDGTLGVRSRGGNGAEIFGQEMGHGFGLGHSRKEGSNDDYLDDWDTMSTPSVGMGSAFGSADNDYCARGPGLNAWNMRSRDWLNEGRVWKSNVNYDYNEIIQLRPLHQKNFPGYLAAELPGIGSHSPYLVEFRVPEFWDAGIPAATILVHRLSGDEERGVVYSPDLIGDNTMNTHSYLMKGANGQYSFGAGVDLFTVE